MPKSLSKPSTTITPAHSHHGFAGLLDGLVISGSNVGDLYEGTLPSSASEDEDELLNQPLPFVSKHTNSTRNVGYSKINSVLISNDDDGITKLWKTQ